MPAAHSCTAAGLAALALSIAAINAQAQSRIPATSPCAAIPHADHPSAYLTNGAVDLVLYLPDATNGYYRSSRFDWSGIIACASYRGRTYFGEWFNQYDPMTNDAVTGPAEEFRAADGMELGYAEAGATGEFIKPGVGVLQRVGDVPYRFGTVYPIVDHGTWTTKVTQRSVTFTQVLRSKLGYSYRYTKTVELDPRQPIFRLRHTLVNLGQKDITTQIYNHDFFMLDHATTGPQDVVKLGFAPTFDPATPSALRVQGNTIQFLATPDAAHVAQGAFSGFAGTPGEYRVQVTNTETKTAILQTSDSPVTKAYFWSTAKTICPELYTSIHVPVGGQQDWSIRYELQAGDK
ncbi:hypothetical protein [Terriglobus aquaticus]|uniref:Uncharacterized protein n=1 Tax=Terriglobus aquaticus TaxID=940139 RepID=A0ABW9KQ53_9BACT|nr:hypothetical protein [Terriglobus aquaticus]